VDGAFSWLVMMPDARIEFILCVQQTPSLLE
jgi:hypothetical protein